MKKRKGLIALILIVIMILQNVTEIVVQAENVNYAEALKEVAQPVVEEMDNEETGNSASGGEVEEDIQGIKTEAITKATNWLLSEQETEGYWGDKSFINDTCLVLSVLQEKNETAVNWVKEYDTQDTVDVISRSCNANIDLVSNLKKLTGMQNEDGGYGLNEDYESDIYDTLLALEYLINVQNYDEELIKSLNYIISNQQEDGGWSYDNESTNTELTVRIALILCKAKYDFGIQGEALKNAISNVSEYIEDKCTIDFSDEQLLETLYYISFQVEKNKNKKLIEYSEKLYDIQKENGSFGNSIIETVTAISLLQRINVKMQQKTKISNFEISCNPQFIYVNNDSDITIEANIQYKSVYDSEYKLITKEIVEGEEITSKETAITLNSEETSVNTEVLCFTCKESEAKQITIQSYLYNDEGDMVQQAQTALEVREKLIGTEVLLIQDELPWKSAANENVLNNLGICFDKMSTSNVMNTNLLNYRVIIVANDQRT